MPGTVAAQSSSPAVETDPSVPSSGAVTVYFNAEEGNAALEDYTGDIYAHTGVFTSSSPSSWTCVKNYWPTEGQFSTLREDTKLSPVNGDPNRYSLDISDIRSYYNDGEGPACNLGSDDEITSMNFVFRDASGDVVGRASNGDDIFVQLANAGQPIDVNVVQPVTSQLDPFVTDQDQTVSIEAAAALGDGATLTDITLSVDGSQIESTTSTTLTYDYALDTPGRYDFEVVATGQDSTGASVTSTKSFYMVRVAPVTEQAVPAGMEDGINYTSSSSAVLVLQAPAAQYVHVIGDETDWEVDPSLQMNREVNTASTGQDSIRYWIELPGLTSGKEYGFQYLVNGELRIPDPFSEKVLTPNDQYIDSSTYPNLKAYPTGQTEQLVSVLETGQPTFNFSSFDRPKQKDLVVYELLIRDFIENHDYQTMQDTLGYLKNLGINAIELMPVSEFDGNQSWGYNPSMHFAADKYYGPREELKRFTDLAHQNGIAVILDVVYNHATGQSPLIRLANEGTFGPPTPDNPWANPSARHPFNVFNDMNHESVFTQYWLDRMNEYWLTEYNVDGFRFDLSKGFTQGPDPDGYSDVGAWSSRDPERIALLQRMADQIWSVDNRAYIILEHFADTSEEKELAEYRIGEGLPGMMLWNNVHGGYNEASMGYATSSSFNNSYYKNRGISVPNYVSYMESHDEQWMMYNNIAFGNSSSDGSYDVTKLETALNRQKLVGAFFFTLPGPRMIWQFGELGYGYGDSGEQCLQSGAGNCPSSAPGRTGEKPIRWDYFDPDQSPNRVKLHDAWSAMINLRQQHEVFRATDTDVTIEGNNTPGRRIQLLHPTMNVVIVGNVGVTPQVVQGNFPSNGDWYDFFSGETINIDDGEAADGIPLAPGQFHIFTSQPVQTPKSGLVPFDVAAPAPDVPEKLTATEDNAAGEVNLTWSASTSVDVTGYRIYRGTTSAFDTTGASIGTVGVNTTSYTDASAMSGQSYVYYVVATDNDGQSSPLSNEATALLYPNELTVDVTRSFGSGSNQQDYRLIALPGDASTSLASTFDGSAGEDWQAYWDNGTSQDFLKKFDSSSTFDFTAGRGFWAIAPQSWSVQADVPTVSLRSRPDETFITIPVHPGWNIISNPLDKGIDWSAVQAANDVSQPLWRFDGSFRRTSVFASALDGEAFYYNNTKGANILELPYSSTNSTNSVASTKRGRDLTRLTATLAAGPAKGVDTRIEMGVSSSAANRVGDEDIIAPPQQFETISLQIDAGDATVSSRQRMLKRSVRTDDAEGHAFEATLFSEPHTPVTLRLENLPGGKEARLINRVTGESIDLRTKPTTEFIPKQASTSLTLLIGSTSFVESEEERLVPDELTFWPNYPNPFRGSTTLEYTLPKDAYVTLEVYDILGRRVETLVDKRQRSGLHTLQWDGTGASGRPLASGIYFGRITVDGQTATRKMTIVR